MSLQMSSKISDEIIIPPSCRLYPALYKEDKVVVPEQEFWLAIIRLAAEDISGYNGYKRKMEIFRWMMTEDFIYVCNNAGYAPTVVRHKLIKCLE